MTPALFRAFSDIAYEKAGISLRDGKEALVSARVARRLRDLSLPDEGSYLEFLRADTSGGELVAFLDAITTNFTSFYREPDHFEVLRDDARHAAAEGHRYRVWCAAASSGEEPYTIARTLAEAFGDTGSDWRVLATDISTKVLATAAAGRYGARQLEPVPRALLSRHFSAVDRRPDGEQVFEASRELRAHVVFRRLNLATPPFPMQGPLDVVMCRNVMIYFDRPVRERLIAEVERLLRPGGLLMVGHSETLSGIHSHLRALSPSVYQKALP